MAVFKATTRVGITARTTPEDGELPRTQPSVRTDEVEPSMAQVVSIPETLQEISVATEVLSVHVPSLIQSPAPTEETPPLPPAPLSPDTVLDYPFGSPEPELPAHLHPMDC